MIGFDSYLLIVGKYQVLREDSVDLDEIFEVEEESRVDTIVRSARKISDTEFWSTGKQDFYEFIEGIVKSQVDKLQANKSIRHVLFDENFSEHYPQKASIFLISDSSQGETWEISMWSRDLVDCVERHMDICKNHRVFENYRWQIPK